MTSRKALIIGSPDEKIPGVNIDTQNLFAYLKSPIGGYWYSDEIVNLTSPSLSVVRREIESLKSKDYSMVFFAGHGYYSMQKERTIIHLNSKEKMDSLELRTGAPKHTLILDCCRERHDDRQLLKVAMESLSLDSAIRQRPNADQCRIYFNQAIAQCGTGIIVMNSCSVDETAGESEKKGGYYTSSLISSAKKLADRALETIDLKKEYLTLSAQECHNASSAQVKDLSAGRQNPLFESPRSDKKFPFAVVA